MRILKLLTCALVLITVNALRPSLVFAQAALPAPVSDTSSVVNIDTSFDPLKSYSPSMYLKTAINILLGVAGVVCFIILVGGFALSALGSEKDAAKRASKAITGAMIGLAIVFAAYAILYIPRALFNIDLIEVALRPLGT